MLLFIASSLWAIDNKVTKCGQYSIEGRLIQEKSQYYFIANEGSRSEFRIALGRAIPEKDKKYLEHNIESIIQIENQCRYQCYGSYIKFIKIVALDRIPRMFRPEKRLLKEISCGKI